MLKELRDTLATAWWLCIGFVAVLLVVTIVGLFWIITQPAVYVVRGTFMPFSEYWEGIDDILQSTK